MLSSDAQVRACLCNGLVSAAQQGGVMLAMVKNIRL